MNIKDLGHEVNLALTKKPDKELLKLCGDYYQPYYAFMKRVAWSIPHTACAVELGVESGRGIGSIALSGCKVYGIDNAARCEDLVQPLVDRHLGLTFINAASMPVPEPIQQEQIGLLHIDTEHSYAMAEAEFEAYRPYLINGAVVIFDDLHAQEDDVLRYFMSLPYPKIQDDRLHPVCGWGALIYEV